LKMINLEYFIKSLKITWLRRLIQNENSPWYVLFEKAICPVSQFVKFGSLWSKVLKENVTNPFWKEILEHWYEFTTNTNYDYGCSKSNKSWLSMPIWYNDKLSKEILYLPKWFKKGIFWIGDVIGNNGQVLSKEDISNKYNLMEINFLEYLRVRTSVNLYVKKVKFNNDYSFEQPIMPTNLKVLLKSKKGSKDIYKIFNKQKLNGTYKLKWERDLELSFSESDWKAIFKVCFKTVQDNALVWLQYKVIHRILGTNKYLNLIGISTSSTCRLCKSAEESLLHLFVYCLKSRMMWQCISQLIMNLVHVNLEFTQQNIIMGYINFDNVFLPINTIILVTKYYIFSCAYLNRQLNVHILLKKIKKVYFEQKTIAQINFKHLEFEKKWLRFYEVIERI